MSGPERRAQLVRLAGQAVAEQGYLPAPLESLAQRAGVSKPVIYAHFGDAAGLYNAVVEDALAALSSAGVEAAAAMPHLEDAACETAEIFLRFMARNGTALHIIYRDVYMVGRLSPVAVRMRDRILGSLARRLRAEFALPAKEAIGAVNLMLALPEEGGRLAFQGQMTEERAVLVCRQLVLGCLDALRARIVEAE
jgi:AcrR family transcriptional regulator